MNDEFVLPHGLVSPLVETTFNIPFILFGAVCLVALFYVGFRMVKSASTSRLSKYKQKVIENTHAILDMDKSNTLSQKQAYLLWRLVRKTGYYYLGTAFLKAPISVSISMCTNTTNENTSKSLAEFFYQLNLAVYDPHKKLDKSDVKALVSDWLHDEQALTMDSL